MVNKSIFNLTAIVKAADFKTRCILFRISATCHYYASTSFIFPLNIYFVKFFIINCFHDIHNISIEYRKNNLSFRVAESAIVFDNFHAVWCYHKSKIKTALEFSVFLDHRIYCRSENCLHTFFCNFRCIVWIR